MSSTECWCQASSSRRNALSSRYLRSMPVTCAPSAAPLGITLNARATSAADGEFVVKLITSSDIQRDVSRSLDLDVGCLDHLGPFGELGFAVISEFRRRAGDWLEAEYVKTLPDVRQRHDPNDLPIYEVDDLLRRSGRNDDALPVVACNVGVAELSRGRQVRQRPGARPACHRKTAQFALDHLCGSRRWRGEADWGMARNVRAHRQARAVEWYMHKVKPKRQAECLANKVSWRSSARRRIAVFSRIRLYERHKLLHRMRRYRRMDRDD